MWIVKKIKNKFSFHHFFWVKFFPSWESPYRQLCQWCFLKTWNWGFTIMLVMIFGSHLEDRGKGNRFSSRKQIAHVWCARKSNEENLNFLRWREKNESGIPPPDLCFRCHIRKWIATFFQSINQSVEGQVKPLFLSLQKNKKHRAALIEELQLDASPNTIKTKII